MKRYLYILIALLTFSTAVRAEEFDVGEMISEHLSDSYEWHIAGHVAIPLPVIAYSSMTGWHVFMSDKLEEGGMYDGLCIDEETGKIRELPVFEDKDGYPHATSDAFFIDLSITKNVLELFIVCIVLCSVILFVAHWYKKNGYKKAPGGFIGAMEYVIEFVDNEVAKDSIGEGYGRFSPYLLTVFFFILTCNLFGLFPVFPGGANLTGNISITIVLAISAFIAINFFASKAYYKDIFWPHVPLFLKAPVPLMPAIEFIGVFTKPFALCIRLFANIFAGHTVILALTSLIFITVTMGVAINTGMTIVAVLFGIFMNCMELFVAVLQAYVFTILTATFIGMAQNE